MEDNHDKETSTDEVRRQYKRIQKKNGVEGEKARFSALNLLYSGYRLKRPGRGADYPPPSSTDVKERAELYFYPPPPPGHHGLFQGDPVPLLYNK